MARLDPHSFADDAHPHVRSLHWDARVDFARRVLDAEVTLTLDGPSEGPLHLDTRDLELLSARDDQGRAVPFALDPRDPVLGARLALTLAPGTRAVTSARAPCSDGCATTRCPRSSNASRSSARSPSWPTTSITV